MLYRFVVAGESLWACCYYILLLHVTCVLNIFCGFQLLHSKPKSSRINAVLFFPLFFIKIKLPSTRQGKTSPYHRLLALLLSRDVLCISETTHSQTVDWLENSIQNMCRKRKIKRYAVSYFIYIFFCSVPFD